MISVLSHFLAFALSLQSAEGPAPAPEAEAGSEALRVVELFTSQGCPMCPGANALLASLGEDPDGGVLAIAYGVDYWDIYGWEDTFAMETFTARQQAYVDAGEAHRVYTPHFVINGAPEKIRYSEGRVRTAVGAAPGLPSLVDAGLSEGEIVIRLDGPVRETPATVWLVTYFPGVETRLIEDGPNAGQEMVHYNMARDIQALGEWTGDALTLTAAAPEGGLAAAILVQDGPGGRLLGAARVE
ncbi:MAG: DUF1223 domain-containing protein [Alphaproteobacteria bacterium]|nr:DUF1223 domain-containing protein [Alphaproteobacteria bacterium]